MTCLTCIVNVTKKWDKNSWRTHTGESVENGYTREKEDGTTKNKVERRVPTILEKYRTESGRGDGQGDVEKEDLQSYRQSAMDGPKPGLRKEESRAWGQHPTS